MTAALISMALLAVGLAGAVAVLAIRNGGLKADKSGLSSKLQASEAQLQYVAREYRDYKAAASSQLQHLRNEISLLEDDLEACSDPDVLRDRLRRLLQAATARQRSQGDP